MYNEESFILDQSKKRHRGGPKRDQIWNCVNIHSDSFEPISRSRNLQTDDINDTSLSIEEVIDLSNPAFIGNNDSFILLF